MTILDTNILSALMRQTPEPQVVSWLDQQPRSSIWTTSITLLEIRFGLQILAAGKRQTTLIQAFEELLQAIDHRIAPFDTDAAEYAGALMASCQKRGRPGDLRDTMIAGIVLAHGATLVTRNTTHFDDLSTPLIDPWSL